MKRYQVGLIRPPQVQYDEVTHKDGDTGDIISTVLYGDKKAAWYTEKFAQTLKGKTLFETCRNIWEFVKTQIPYVLDPKPYQDIKSPGRLWQLKQGDCKSFSVFIGSCLKNLKIPYGYRFASYDSADPTPTHVYVFVPLATGGEIILDAVWSGPFNTQKQYTHKIDKMAVVRYLGNTDKHIPGVLKITKPVDEMSEGELDLLLARQRIEIDKANAMRVGIHGIEGYDEALKTVNHCLRNIDNPAVISGIGDEFIAGGQVGKLKVGKFLKKVGKGIAKGAKALVKVITLPLRMVAKGAMEIYLPKAAPFFLYLFAANPDKLPDVMKRKRKKAEKFKKFVVNGLGMREKHFMAIIRNNLTKRLGKQPESYLADMLKKRISGIGNPKAAQRQAAAISGSKTKPRNLRPKAVRNYNSTLKNHIAPSLTTRAQVAAFQNWANENKGLSLKVDGIIGPQTKAALVKYGTEYQNKAMEMPLAKLQADPNVTLTADDDADTDTGDKGGVIVNKANMALQTFQEGKETFSKVASKIASGDLIGGAIAAISWLISKISALVKKGDKMEPITAHDFPDVERDASNTFEWQDMHQDYSNLNTDQKAAVKETATEIMEEKVPPQKVYEVVQQRLPDLNQSQAKEVAEEIIEGPEALDESEGRTLANDIKKDGWNTSGEDRIKEENGGGNRGFCHC
ncbi:MAG: peptidoglycan-binding protein [Sphingobacteriales bacterium]|nr:MAG: peptidoglycan-binding protein [Sphingobacteriales bacterium]